MGKEMYGEKMTDESEEKVEEERGLLNEESMRVKKVLVREF